MTKIDNNFGNAGFINKENRSKERTPGGKAFGDFMSVGDDDLRRNSSTDFETESENESRYEERGQSFNPFGSIFGRQGSSKDNQSTGQDNNNDSEQPRQTSSRPEHDSDERNERKVAHKPKRPIAKGEDFDEDFNKDEKMKLSETQPYPMPAFQVPMQVERINFTAPVEKTSPVVAPQMIDQIVQEVRLGINAQGAIEFQFDLKSEVFDGLKLKISTKDGQVSASFIAENVHVKDAIDQGAQELIQALRDKGLEVSNFQVSVGADSSGGGQQGQQQQGQQQGSYQEGYRSSGFGEVSSGSSATTSNNSSSSSVDQTNTKYTI